MIRILTKLLSYEIICFGFVGAMNTAFSYGVYVLGIFLGFKYQIASLASIILGIAFSFITQGTMVFKGMSAKAFVRYIFAWCILYLLNIWLIGQLQKFFVSLYLAGLLAILPIALMGYFSSKFFVFR
jgi:putative flippase GtrA